MTSTQITDYLGRGALADRPASPPVAATALALYYATDAASLAQWNGSAWADVTTPSINAAVTAAGSSQGTATQLAAALNIVTTVGSGTGVILDAAPTAAMVRRVLNRGANPLSVYPGTGGQIEALGTNAAATIAVGGAASFIAASSTQWYAQ